MKTITVQNIDSTIESLRPKPNKELRQKVLSIISGVQSRGDTALRDYEWRFNKVKLRSFRVSSGEIRAAYGAVSQTEIDAIKIAKKRLEKAENAVKRQFRNITFLDDGVKIVKVFSPIEKVGCYIPGGKAHYPSTVVMAAVPAKVAGVKRIVAVSPANQDGTVDALTLVAADICGVDEFYKIGGAQAIAALTFGTRSVPRVDKIVGPGGQFVTLAKSLLSDTVSIDMVAGPTELAIIGDSSTNPDLVALDLISQAEHSPDTMCCLITTSKKLKDEVISSLQKVKRLKRSEIVEASLKKNGFIAICKGDKEVIEFANKLAPEHLEIITKNSKKIAAKISCAGLTLVGQNSPSSASDYLLGSNHILPTNGFGRTRGSLGVLDFIKIDTKIESSKTALTKISRYMKAITEAEGLPNHYEAVKRRLA